MKSDEKLAVFWFRWLGNFGVSLSIAIFLLYGSGLIRSRAEPAEIAANWSEETPIYLEKMDLGREWLINIGDLYSMNVAAIAVLVSTVLPILLILSFTWYRKLDFLFGTMAIAVSIVLAIAILGFR